MPLIKPEGERIATVEQQMKDLQDKLNEVGNDVKEIRGMVQVKLNDHIILSSQIIEIKKEIKQLQGTSLLWKWLSPTLAAVVGSIITFLVIHFLNNL